MLIRGDARRIPLRDGCVQCCVTSPPYWGLRDYGHGGQIGLEPTPDAYVASLVSVFRDVRRVLREDATCWIVLGDSYAGYWGEKYAHKPFGEDRTPDESTPPHKATPPWKTLGVKPKDLIGIPWRVAFALQADGWYLRSAIVWHKPNPMPESVTDRPTSAYELLFLLAKAERYYYDADAIAEPGTGRAAGNTRHVKGAGNNDPFFRTREGFAAVAEKEWHARNKRNVWTIPTQPYPEAHFATYPEKLIEPCILAGSREGDLVLDPFIGSGTTGAVCDRLMRRWVGLDLTYQHLSKARTLQRGLRFTEEIGDSVLGSIGVG